MTDAEKLVNVRAAILKIEEGAQSVTVDGVSVTRADLGILYAREERLEAKVAKAAKGSGRTLVDFR